MFATTLRGSSILRRDIVPDEWLDPSLQVSVASISGEQARHFTLLPPLILLSFFSSQDLSDMDRWVCRALRDRVCILLQQVSTVNHLPGVPHYNMALLIQYLPVYGSINIYIIRRACLFCVDRLIELWVVSIVLLGPVAGAQRAGGTKVGCLPGQYVIYLYLIDGTGVSPSSGRFYTRAKRRQQAPPHVY